MSTKAPSNISKGAPDSGSAEKSTLRKGMIAGIFCYICWGVFPLYWKLLDSVDPFEIIAQRIIWCTVFTLAICLILRLDFIALLKSKRVRKYLIPSAILISINWTVYVYAVSIDRIIETAIGYYLNPLVSILLGMIVFKERLSVLEICATVLCSAGILFFTFNYGAFPWISILLAISFGVYGAVKKKGGYPAVEALAFENLVALVPAIVLAIAMAQITGAHGFLGDTASLNGWVITLLLIGGGIVTAIPLILFATAANNIPLTILGFLQYISPTIALMLGVFVNGEPFTLAHAVCLACIWSGLALVGISSIRSARKQSTEQAPR